MNDAILKQDIKDVTEAMCQMLTVKNERYGNSVFEPVPVFANIIALEPDHAVKKILIRISDKLGRIQNSTELRKNDVADIVGYLLLVMIRKEWTHLADLID